MILNVVKYSSAFITVLFGFHFLKTERERILLLLKEKDDKLQLSQERILDLEKKLMDKKNRSNYILCKYLPKGPDSEPSPEPSPYNSCDEGKLDTELDTELNTELNTELDTELNTELNTELDTDKTNYDNEIDNGIVNDLQNDISEDSIEELVHSNEINDNNSNSNRGIIEFTE